MIYYFLIFIFGTAIGSFLNVLIFRLPQGKKINGRSKCPVCGHQLSWQDLVPLLSFLAFGGKCRYCRKTISWQYPIVEFVTGILFIIVAYFVLNYESGIMNYGFRFRDLFGNYLSAGEAGKLGIGNFINLIYLLFITSCLIVIFVSDLRFYIIPDEIIIAGCAGTFLYIFFAVWDFKIWDLFRNWKLEIRNFETLGLSLLVAFGTSAFFLAIILATKGKGMGLGDAKFAFLIGFVLGWPNVLVALLFAFFWGAFLGLALILAGRAKMKSELPFGTFLAAGTFFSLLFGEPLVQSYLGLFF